MKKGIVLVWLACLFLSGCASKSDYEAAVSARDHLWAGIEEDSNYYALLSGSFDADLCGRLSTEDRSVYQVVIDRNVEDYNLDLATCAVTMYSKEDGFQNEITSIYVKYVDPEGKTIVDVLLEREAPGEKFELKK